LRGFRRSADEGRGEGPSSRCARAYRTNAAKRAYVMGIFAYRWPGPPEVDRSGVARPMESPHRFEIPRLTALLLHALPRVVEGMIAPVVVFYAGLILLGLNGALVTAVAWVYGGILVRVVRRRPVPGTLLLAALGVTARAALAAVTGSAVVYFLQP